MCTYTYKNNMNVYSYICLTVCITLYVYNVHELHMTWYLDLPHVLFLRSTQPDCSNKVYVYMCVIDISLY